ncbi:MAG TPA: hypothetical protein VIM53_01830 [Candidatus Saccharimonadales bacterium]
MRVELGNFGNHNTRRVAAGLLCLGGLTVSAEACAGGVPVVLPEPGQTVICAPDNAGHYATAALFKNTEYGVGFENKAGATTYGTDLYKTPKTSELAIVNGSGTVTPHGESAVTISYTSNPHKGEFIVACPVDSGSTAALYELPPTPTS